MRRRSVYAAVLSAALCLTAWPTAAQTQNVQKAGAQAETASDPAAAFEARVREYVRMREALEEKLPALPKEATPEQITEHKKVFLEQVRAARAGARQGQLFTPDVAAYIRGQIKDTYHGEERVELRKTVLEAETRGVPLRVNSQYPESKEMVEMPARLLLTLPQLPKQVKYRFVGRNLLLVDRENTLILDYMTDALPPASGEAAPAAPAEGEKVSAPAPAADPSVRLTLPLKEGSLRFAVIGDTGTGTRQQHELAEVMRRYREAFPFEFVLLTGDNMYGAEKPADFKKKFEDVYKPLLDQQIKFYASLGNHDESNQRFYEHFNMGGEEYYHFKKGPVSFYALNSNYMDAKQLKWLEEKLAADKSEWKIAFFHHPPYSSGGKHGSSSDLREVVEPVFLRHGVDAVFAGHEHFYERLKPQKGIYYFISGAGGKLRKGDVRDNSPLTEKAYDEDMSFMLLEVVGAELHFQVISRTGETVDSGVITRTRAT